MYNIKDAKGKNETYVRLKTGSIGTDEVACAVHIVAEPGKKCVYAFYVNVMRFSRHLTSLLLNRIRSKATACAL